MTDEVAGENDKVTSAIEVSSATSEVDAGMEMILKGKVSCSDGSDRLGETIQILDHDSEVIGTVELVAFDGECNETNELVVTVPPEPGEYNWSAVLPGQELEGVVYEESKADFRFTSKPHATRIEVWDVPPAIATGDEFAIKVGIKCSAGCNHTGREFEIYDQDDRKLASGTLGDEPWRGTKALYFTEVVLTAPEKEGPFRWEVRSPGSESGLPHEAGDRTFGSNVVGRPDYVVTIEAVDKKKQAPIKGIHILLHPFRARTDDQGVARLEVPEGKYHLLVSGFRYFPYRTTIKVSEDVSLKAEVEWEEKPEKISG